MRIGVIGAGGMGREHSTNLAALAGVAVVSVSDPVRDAAAAVAADVGARVVEDGFDMIRSDDLDGLVITSPDDTHAMYALAAIEMGMATLCEKPLAHSLEEAQAVVAAERAAGKDLIQIGLMRVFDPAHIELRAALEDLGQPLHIRCIHRNAHPRARPVGTVIVQSLVHDFHTIRWLSGAEVERVSTSFVGPADAVRYVHVTAQLSSGAVATVEFDEQSYGYEVAVEVTALDGVVTTGQSGAVAIRQDGQVRYEIGSDWFSRFHTAYRAEATAWVDALRAGQGVAGPGAMDGLRSQAIADAAIESVETARAVTVPDVGVR
ncbi:MAG: Gfo/Idh/MocA family oxidoreductase [Acidimicrobiia bacterium]|nr:Gfo/Idh/MocA family oxidoreductase [Acidimicrobiia bacterium]